MARRVMRQRTNRPNGAHMKQGFAIVETSSRSPARTYPVVSVPAAFADLRRNGNPIVIFASYGDQDQALGWMPA
jgi:hypothetical protein